MQQAMNGVSRPEPVKPVTFTVKTFTEMYGVSRTTVFSLLSQGKLERVRIGRRTLITVASVEALVAQNGGE